MQRNEFGKPVPKDGIVEFEATPDKVNYTPENWNASVLWNFLAEAIHGSLDTEIDNKFSPECIEKVGQKIAEHYKNIDGIEDLVNKAVSDIHEYAEALGLYEYLRESCKNKTGFYSNIQTIKTDDCVTKIKITNAMIKGNDRNEQTEITVVYKDNNTLAYKVFDNRYVTLNQDMSINTEIKGTDPIYIYINDGSEEQDREYLKSRQNVVAVLELIDDMPVLQGIISAVIKEMKFKKPDDCYIAKFLKKIHYKKWYDRDTKYKAELIKNFEKGFIKYVNTFCKPGDETTRERLKSKLAKITSEQSCADTIDLILEILQTERHGEVVPNGRREISNDAVVYYPMRVNSLEATGLLIDRTNTTKIVPFHVRSIMNKLEDAPDIQVKSPDLIILSLNSHTQNIARTNDEEIDTDFTIEDFNYITPYRLLGVVTKNLTTGEIYSEYITEYGKSISRFDEDTHNAPRFGDDPNKLRLISIYRKGYSQSKWAEG